MNEVQANYWGFASIDRTEFTCTKLADRERLQIVVKGEHFDKVLPSWNGSAPNGSYMEIRIQPMVPNAPDFILGRWSQGDAGALRTSINDQKSPVGLVKTDILELNKSATSLVVTIDCFPGPGGNFATLDRFHILLVKPLLVMTGSFPQYWNTLLDVPYRAQAKYVGGGVLCSPTSVSMILSYWSKKLDRPGLDFDVPDVQRGVFDPGWNGTGNWPFNVAFAGSLPGMTGYVTQLRMIQDIENFVACGVPVATSVSYDLLKGKPKKGANDGHLVVIVGFDKEGRPIFNDPGRNVVRMVYERDAFVQAWASSQNTVYLIHPEGWNIPDDGPWPTKKKD
ncbi:MAG: C39 family peptidase [Fimbriimonadaceae bacterium]|nr:C39 family peptidase [Fimbriimonadaceae bacterium]